MTGGALFLQASGGSPRRVIRLYKGTGFARLGPMQREVVPVFSKSDKRKPNERTSGETECSEVTMTGGGCARRGYKTFLRLLYEFIEATE